MKIQKITEFIFVCIATLVAFFPFNFIVGSKFAWFSCATMAIPAVGFHYSLVYVIFYIFTKSLCSSKLFCLLFLKKMPLICSTLALRKRNAILCVVLPIVAMILFCAHPIGYEACYYSWYWFIPMIIYGFVPDSFISRAISASFVAHAVGSVIWLYKGTIPASVWIELLPIVAIERVIIAAGMVGFVYIFQAISVYISQKVYAS